MKKNIKFTLLIGLSICLFSGCGGGADVGNPGNFSNCSITGCVKKPDNDAASKARVILGRYSDFPISEDSKDTVVQDGLTVVISKKYFDTTICDISGRFSFDNVSVGEYVIVADLQNKRGIIKVSTGNGDADAVIGLNEPVDLMIKPYSVLDTSNPHFVASRIAGTTLVAKADSAGTILFYGVPSGMVDVVLYKNDTSRQTFRDLTVSPVSGAILMVDPKRSPSYWTAKSSVREYDGRPYILRYGMWNDSLPTVGMAAYDLYIQFSHTMDTYLTSKALHTKSSDSAIQIDEIFWQGADMVYLRLCAKDSTGGCSRNRLLSIPKWTVSIDTSAESKFGYKMAWPEEVEVSK